MTRLLAALLLLAACSRPSAPPTAPRRAATASAAEPTAPRTEASVDVGAAMATANAAYEAGDFPACAAAFARAAAQASGTTRQTAYYNAACCHARAGALDDAFALLHRGIGAGLRDLTGADDDPDLASLRGDPRWAEVVASAAAATAAYERTLGAPALRRELLAMVAEDQAARMQMIAHRDDRAMMDAVAAIDRRTTARMQAIIAASGWPGRAQVGDDGAHAAWLLVQHADLDRPFQKQCLTLMEPLAATGEVSAVDVAYLHDRVAVAEGRPQRYGTQFGDDREPKPIEDPDQVDARRAAIGMPSMAEYRVMMTRMYGPPPTK
jgi:tetratricopeptide (TPR) repeat protein